MVVSETILWLAMSTCSVYREMTSTTGVGVSRRRLSHNRDQPFGNDMPLVFWRVDDAWWRLEQPVSTRVPESGASGSTGAVPACDGEPAFEEARLSERHGGAGEWRDWEASWPQSAITGVNSAGQEREIGVNRP